MRRPQPAQTFDVQAVAALLRDRPKLDDRGESK